MNILRTLQVYKERWQQALCRPLKSSEIASVASAEIVTKDYGHAILFRLNNGKTKEIYIYGDLDENRTELGPISIERLSQCHLLVLSKSTEKDVYIIILN